MTSNVQAALLSELNSLLSQHADLPDFRKHVDRSGNNLKWLRKWSARLPEDAHSDRIRFLTSKTIGELTK
jgi:hypothetical protein